MRYSNQSAVVQLLVLMAAIMLTACTEAGEPVMAGAVTDTAQMQVFKQESCGCCGQWVSHLEDAGFTVSVKNFEDLNGIKSQYGIKPSYQSCHTGVADGYVFEGHIPAAVIQKFLAEKPANVIGLAVPGMPLGSPGMEMGDHTDNYDVVLLKPDGSSEVYAKVKGADIVYSK